MITKFISVFVICLQLIFLNCQSNKDIALLPPTINTSPGEQYSAQTRQFQGIPGIERATNGRLWALWYGGGQGEDGKNFVMLVTSGDDGKTWSDLKLVIDPIDNVRAFDPVLWTDPTGRLWLFWAQSITHFDGRGGVWAITCENPGSENPDWSEPRRLADGVMMNKPIVLSTGEWMFPIALWGHNDNYYGHYKDLDRDRRPFVYVTRDNGKTFEKRGGAIVPRTDRNYDEHMIIEKKDGNLWMLIRTKYGIGESISTDRGQTWTDVTPSKIQHATARFFITRLLSGNLLLVKHGPIDERTDRSRLLAFLSKDDGRTWSYSLMLDERKGVSYPDGFQTKDGVIYIIYDYNRVSDKKILFATFTEEDILNGNVVSDQARFGVLVNQAFGKEIVK